MAASGLAAEKAGGEEAIIDAGKPAGRCVAQQGGVRNLCQVLSDGPEVFFRGHPADAVEAREIDRAGVVAESLLAGMIEVVLEIGHDEFTQGAVDRLAESEAAVIGFGDGSPMTVLLENGEDVVVVAHGLEIEQQGRKALDTESRGTEQGALAE